MTADGEYADSGATFFYYSREVVEQMFIVLQATGTLRDPLPALYGPGTGCGAPCGLADTLASARRQGKRIRADLHDCGVTDCNRYTYTVVP